jgi:hypothetical protein
MVTESNINHRDHGLVSLRNLSAHRRIRMIAEPSEAFDHEKSTTFGSRRPPLRGTGTISYRGCTHQRARPSRRQSCNAIGVWSDRRGRRGRVRSRRRGGARGCGFRPDPREDPRRRRSHVLAPAQRLGRDRAPVQVRAGGVSVPAGRGDRRDPGGTQPPPPCDLPVRIIILHNILNLAEVLQIDPGSWCGLRAPGSARDKTSS